MGAIYVVRHGRASFGAADYDELSPQGERQAQLVGAALRGRGIKPVRVICGALRRQRDTADLLVRAAQWTMPVTVDDGWDEFRLGPDSDSLAVSGHTDSETYQAALETRMRRWGDEGGGTEALQDFADRARRALTEVAASLGSGEDAVVVTSAGVISMLAASLLGGGTESWILLNRVCVNTGLTTFVAGRRGVSLLSFNEHVHLGRSDVTYR